MDPSTLAADAVDDSVTAERLVPAVVEALEDGEQPHYLVRGQSLDRAEPPDVDPETSFPALDASVTVVATDRRVLFVVPKSVVSETASASYEEIEAVSTEHARFEQLEVQTGRVSLTANLDGDVDPEPMAGFVERQAGDEPAARDTDWPDGETAARDTDWSDDEPAARDTGREPTTGTEPAAGDRQTETGTDSADPLDRIEKLAELRDRGVITDAEFEEQKADLLDRL